MFVQSYIKIAIGLGCSSSIFSQRFRENATTLELPILKSETCSNAEQSWLFLVLLDAFIESLVDSIKA